VIRALDGPLASIREIRPHELAAAGAREPFVSMWIAVRSALRSVLEHVTLADLAAGELPPTIAALAADPDSWDPHLPPPPATPAHGSVAATRSGVRGRGSSPRPGRPATNS
jgi:hypothetical protein